MDCAGIITVLRRIYFPPPGEVYLPQDIIMVIARLYIRIGRPLMALSNNMVVVIIRDRAHCWHASGDCSLRSIPTGRQSNSWWEYDQIDRCIIESNYANGVDMTAATLLSCGADFFVVVIRNGVYKLRRKNHTENRTHGSVYLPELIRMPTDGPIASISCGDNHIAVVVSTTVHGRTLQRLITWGRNTRGQVGHNNPATPRQIASGVLITVMCLAETTLCIIDGIPMICGQLIDRCEDTLSRISFGIGGVISSLEIIRGQAYLRDTRGTLYMGSATRYHYGYPCGPEWIECILAKDSDAANTGCDVRMGDNILIREVKHEIGTLRATRAGLYFEYAKISNWEMLGGL